MSSGATGASPASRPVKKRDNLKHIADTTLKAIEAGSISFAANNHLDLAAQVRFSNHNTRYYPPDDPASSKWASDVPKLPPTKTEISILEISTLSGARFLFDTLSRSHSFGRIALLNFASATRPGGGFLDGSQAQEESIARSSTLYPSLMTDTAQKFYKLHRDRRGGFYHHAMIYTPSVVIFRDDAGDWVTPFEVDVLTSAAVNAGDIRNKNGRHADPDELERKIESAMRERMGRILSLMERQGAKNLVLGSFGTGVFQNSVKMVARIWADLLTSKGARYRSSFDRVVFAILGTTTFTAFNQTLRNEAEKRMVACPTTVIQLRVSLVAGSSAWWSEPLITILAVEPSRDDMALINVQLKDLTLAIRKTGQHPFDVGKHADIWLGEYIDPKQRTYKVAIKVIRSSFTAEEAKQFNEKLLREARLWTTLGHDNIVPFLGIMTSSDMSRHPAPALVSPYYKNGSLKKYVSNNTLTLPGKMDLLYQVASGVAFLHGRRVVHGDIKPGNILISDEGQAVLADFGLSIVLEMSGFTTKNTPGTLRYMAPELLAEPTTSAAIRPTAATDAWAFAITATEIFSAKQPYYDLPNDAAVLYYVTQRHRRLRYDDYRLDIGGGLWSALEKCWKQSPDKRPSMDDIKGFVDKKRSSYS